MPIKQIICYLFSILIFTSCDTDKLDVDVSDIEVDTKIRRFDQALFEQNVDQIEKSLPRMTKEFPVFFLGSKNTQEDIDGLVAYILNPLNQKLYLRSIDVHKDFQRTETQIIEALKHYKYHFPEKDLPEVYTYISMLNFEQPIIAEDSFLLVGLDLFLGPDFKEYETYRVPKFITKKFDKKYISSATMRSMATQQFGPYFQGSTMLDYMINLGRIEYFVRAMEPNIQDSIQFAFTPSQMEWCENKEAALWQHLSKKKLLFSKDYHEFKKYIEDQPFISSLERESPGRAAVWIGFNIVKEFAQRNDVTLEQLLLEYSPDEIFRGSKYAP